MDRGIVIEYIPLILILSGFLRLKVFGGSRAPFYKKEPWSPKDKKLYVIYFGVFPAGVFWYRG